MNIEQKLLVIEHETYRIRVRFIFNRVVEKYKCDEMRQMFYNKIRLITSSVKRKNEIEACNKIDNWFLPVCKDAFGEDVLKEYENL